MSFVKRLFGRALKSDDSPPEDARVPSPVANAGDHNGNLGPSVCCDQVPAWTSRRCRHCGITVLICRRCGASLSPAAADRQWGRDATDVVGEMKAVCCCQHCQRTCRYCADCPHQLHRLHVTSFMLSFLPSKCGVCHA